MSHHNDTGKAENRWLRSIYNNRAFTICIPTGGIHIMKLTSLHTANELLHFIEVKTRRSNTYGNPEESISRKKLNVWLKGGAAYQEQYPPMEKGSTMLSITCLPENR